MVVSKLFREDQICETVFCRAVNKSYWSYCPYCGKLIKWGDQ